MKDNQRTACDLHGRLDNLVAELTSAIYPLVLRRGPKGLWLQVELGLWRTLAETVEEWDRHRPAAASSAEQEAWRESLLGALTEGASSIALENGIQGPLPELELDLYGAVRRVTQGCSRVGESE